jgi:hypothetical protein
MSNGLDLVKAHFQRLTAEKKTVHVPEWDMEVYFSPLTIKEYTQADKNSKSTAELGLNLIVLKARNSNGDLLFKWEERHDLMRMMPVDIMTRLAREIHDDSNSLVGEAEKN